MDIVSILGGAGIVMLLGLAVWVAIDAIRHPERHHK